MNLTEYKCTYFYIKNRTIVWKCTIRNVNIHILWNKPNYSSDLTAYPHIFEILNKKPNYSMEFMQIFSSFQMGK